MAMAFSSVRLDTAVVPSPMSIRLLTSPLSRENHWMTMRQQPEKARVVVRGKEKGTCLTPSTVTKESALIQFIIL